MIWFLVALSFSGPGEAPLMQAREIGPGPVAMVACDMEAQLSEAFGTPPQGFQALKGSDFFCVDTPRLCAMHATAVPVENDLTPALTVAQQRHCKA